MACSGTIWKEKEVCVNSCTVFHQSPTQKPRTGLAHHRGCKQKLDIWKHPDEQKENAFCIVAKQLHERSHITVLSSGQASPIFTSELVL